MVLRNQEVSTYPKATGKFGIFFDSKVPLLVGDIFDMKCSLGRAHSNANKKDITFHKGNRFWCL